LVPREEGKERVQNVGSRRALETPGSAISLYIRED
jgi:hypothetical protein